MKVDYSCLECGKSRSFTKTDKVRSILGRLFSTYQCDVCLSYIEVYDPDAILPLCSDDRRPSEAA